MGLTRQGRLGRSARSKPGYFTMSVLVGAAALMIAQAARADAHAVVNTLRTQGCAGNPGIGTTVQRHEALDDVAQELARRSLSDAIKRVGYLAMSSTSFHVRGSREDQEIRRALAERYCAAVNDSRYSELGVFQSGDNTWVVLAAPMPAPPVLDPAAVEQRVLELVNLARAEGRKCGRDTYDAAPPLLLSATLTLVALHHASDMAARGSLGHAGSDGSTSAERITRAGYQWVASGENIAAGQRDADTVVAGWLESPPHCATLMGPSFKEMGIAFALAPSGNPSIYWAQEFGAPQ